MVCQHYDKVMILFPGKAHKKNQAAKRKQNGQIKQNTNQNRKRDEQ